MALERCYQLANDSYNFIWCDQALSIKDIRSQADHVRINHFAEITQITRKNKMASNLNSMRVLFPKDYGFYPETWLLPMDHHKIMKKHWKGKVYIVKPDNGCQGRGIYLVDAPMKLER